ncbi:hypothetical protein [Bacillus sp. TL12]|nr:hypothetical protein [Bacillus sp. TL12]MCI0767271.1 hypothetical protein [Bacillus sp. TL12]
MKKAKIIILTIMSIGVFSLGLSNLNFKEIGIEQKSNTVLVQYSHGKGI